MFCIFSNSEFSWFFAFQHCSDFKLTWISIFRLGSNDSHSFCWYSEFCKDVHDDPVFWPSLGRTILYGAMSIPLGIITSLMLALAMNRPLKGIAIFRVIYFIPYVSSMIAVAMVWKWLYNDQFGLINTIIDVCWTACPKLVDRF